MWRCMFNAADERHVMPVDDLKPHHLSANCWCHPVDDDGVWVHNSLDRREEYETGRKKH